MDKIKQEKLMMMSKLAHMYYCQEMTQLEIAGKTYMSRSQVSKLLKEAKATGVVQIIIRHNQSRCIYLEQALKKKLGLKEALVYECSNEYDEEVRNIIGHYAGTYIQEKIHDNMSIGITRGTIIASMVENIAAMETQNVTIVQLLGTEMKDALDGSGQDLIFKMAGRLNAGSVFLNAPLYVKNDQAYDSLLRDPLIRRQMKMAEHVDLIITGIKSLHLGSTSHVWAGYVDDKTIGELVEKGAVGHIFGRAFDQNGNLIDHHLNRNIIAVPMETVKRSNVVLLVYGKDRARAAVGAIKGGYVKTVITGDRCAKAMLELIDM